MFVFLILIRLSIVGRIMLIIISVFLLRVRILFFVVRFVVFYILFFINLLVDN